MSQKVSDLFDVAYGHSLELVRLTQADSPGAVNFVARTQKNNGITARVAPIEKLAPSPAGALSVALGGTVLETFVQPAPWYSGRDIAVLTPRDPTMTLRERLFWALCIRANKYRYNYGRQANRTLKDLDLSTEIPAWMTQVPIRDISAAREAAARGSVPALDPDHWHPFRYDELFEIEKGTRLTKQDQTPGSTPFIGSSRMNNGVTAHIGQTPAHPAGCITVSYNGSVAEAFYQPHPFFATDDVNVFYSRHGSLTVEARLFICALIRREAYRYNYGRKWSLEGMKSSRIKLPVTKGGQPDWQWMTSYIRHLPFSKPLVP